MQDFDLPEWYSSVLKSQHKHNIINFNTHLDHNRNVVPIAGLHMLTIMALGVPTCWERICALKPAQAHRSFQSSFC